MDDALLQSAVGVYFKNGAPTGVTACCLTSGAILFCHSSTQKRAVQSKSSQRIYREVRMLIHPADVSMDASQLIFSRDNGTTWQYLCQDERWLFDKTRVPPLPPLARLHDVGYLYTRCFPRASYPHLRVRLEDLGGESFLFVDTQTHEATRQPIDQIDWTPETQDFLRRRGICARPVQVCVSGGIPLMDSDTLAWFGSKFRQGSRGNDEVDSEHVSRLCMALSTPPALVCAAQLSHGVSKPRLVPVENNNDVDRAFRIFFQMSFDAAPLPLGVLTLSSKRPIQLASGSSAVFWRETFSGEDVFEHMTPLWRFCGMCTKLRSTQHPAYASIADAFTAFVKEPEPRREYMFILYTVRARVLPGHDGKMPITLSQKSFDAGDIRVRSVQFARWMQPFSN